MPDLRGAAVVITGASSGLGRATALAFAREGAKLALAARSVEDLRDVAGACAQLGSEAVAVPTDISDPAAVQRLADRAVERFGRIDVWVEVAAVLIAGPFEAHQVGELRRLIDTNVAGSAFGAHTAMRRFRTQDSGVLVIVSSLLGLMPAPAAPAYAMSKFAMRGLALSLRQAVADNGRIHVCTVLPGPVDTPMYQRAANRTGREVRAIPPASAPERVARAVVGCARRPRRQTTAGLASWAALVFHRLTPRLTEWVVAQYSARTLTRRAAAPDTGGAVFERRPGGFVHGGWRRGRLRRRLGEQERPTGPPQP